MRDSTDKMMHEQGIQTIPHEKGVEEEIQLDEHTFKIFKILCPLYIILNIAGTLLYLSLCCKLMKYISGDKSAYIIESIALSFRLLVFFLILSVASIILGLKLIMMSNGPSQVLLLVILILIFSTLSIVLVIWWGHQFEKLASFRKQYQQFE